MSETTADERDCAWVKVQIPLDPEALQAFLRDLPRLFRLNPFLELQRAQLEPEGTLRLAGRNESNGQPLDVALTPSVDGPRQIVLRYANGIKRETRFDIAPDPAGCVLTITEVYDPVAEAQREERIKLLDKSLVPWAAALRRHLLLRSRWGWVPGYLSFMDRWWLSMTPRQRRIGWLLTWTTALEFAVFLVAVALWG